MSNSPDYEEALAYLQTDNGDGATMYDHISSIILKVLTERPENSHVTYAPVSPTSAANPLTVNVLRGHKGKRPPCPNARAPLPSPH